MSWSIIVLGDYWAHAHDTEQILFMSLAPEFLDSSDEFRQVSWLQDWKAYWLEHKSAHGNGCSDIALERFLDTELKIRQFRSFLAHYKIWLAAFGDAIAAADINAKTDVPFYLIYTGPCSVDYLLAFATKIEDVLDGNLKNESVRRKSLKVSAPQRQS